MYSITYLIFKICFWHDSDMIKLRTNDNDIDTDIAIISTIATH